MDHTQKLDEVRRFYANEKRETTFESLAFEFEEQLHEEINDSADLREDAVTITLGANIMMAEQNYVDLRRYIDRMRAWRAAFGLEATQSDARMASAGEDLERVMSAMSDATYRTVHSSEEDKNNLIVMQTTDADTVVHKYPDARVLPCAGTAVRDFPHELDVGSSVSA